MPPADVPGSAPTCSDRHPALSTDRADGSRRFQFEKMAMLGEIMVGIAHELNTPIAYIASNLTSLAEYFIDFRRVLAEIGPAVDMMRASSDPHLASQGARLAELMRTVGFDMMVEDLEQIVKESNEGAYQAKSIVDDVRTFARHEKDAASFSDLNECLKLSLRIARNEIKYKADVQRALDEIPQIKCRPGELRQVFVNLLINAAQAIEARGVIRVESEQDGEHVIVRIVDTGCGIPPELAAEIFKPFVTTKEAGKGTGIGLYVVKEIVAGHAGTIQVDSEVGQGTTFTLRLPIDQAE